ncbi:MAG: hypothetical protein IKL36_05855 [Clostridia bacterium]|nr:hypothetical protein [Clostridia bacterium]
MNPTIETLKEDIESLVSKYEKELNENRITINVSKKYFERNVWDWRTFDHDYGLGFLYRKREKIYNNLPNRYNCIVLSLIPSDKSSLKKELCRDYAFFFSKIERLHTGKKPKEYICEKGKLTHKIENKIKKIIKKASKVSAEKLCRDTWLDAMRYVLNSEYGYKKKVLNKDISYFTGLLYLCLGIFALAGFIFSCILLMMAE